MNRSLLTTGILFILTYVLQAQSPLTPDFHQEKREAVRTRLPPNSVAVFFANAIRNRANDVDYHYHQDPNFFYLTGFKEPHSLLLIFSNDQKAADGSLYNEVLFVQPHHYREELYDGPRLGVKGAREKLGIAKVHFNTEFADFQLLLEQLDKILFFDFNNDVRDVKGKNGDLYDLIMQFKEKVGYPADFNPYRESIHEQILSTKGTSDDGLTNYLEYMLERNPELKNDEIILGYLNAETDIAREEIVGNIAPPKSKLDALTLGNIMAELREVKSPQEVDFLRRAVDISCLAQAEVMKAMHPDMSETEIYGIHAYIYKKYGAMFEGYPGIVGAGHNGCVLHYIQNDKPRVGDDLVLMDLGAEFHGYTADVTRTIPANGKFSPEQKAIYELVYRAQEEAFKYCKPGQPIRITTQISREVIAAGLLELGIINDASEVGKYFPHGVSHHIGLDVHDPGKYENFEENMVLTVEPGIYIPEEADTDPKWWGIGVRIEDCILITKDGYELLSNKAPRKLAEIEALMKKESPLSKFVLPSLED